MNLDSKDSSGHVVIIRRKMTVAQYERIKRAAKKMVKDVRKFVKRKRLK